MNHFEKEDFANQNGNKDLSELITIAQKLADDCYQDKPSKQAIDEFFMKISILRNNLGRRH